MLKSTSGFDNSSLLCRRELEEQRRLQIQLQSTTTSRPVRPPPRPNRPTRPPTRPTRPTSRPTRPQRPVNVAAVRPPPSRSANQIPRNQSTNNLLYKIADFLVNLEISDINKSEARRGKVFRENNSRNRIFPPPPNIPETNFDCANYEFAGLYADTEANCEVFFDFFLVSKNVLAYL